MRNTVQQARILHADARRQAAADWLHVEPEAIDIAPFLATSLATLSKIPVPSARSVFDAVMA